MSPELIAILAVGVGLAGLVVTSQCNPRNDFRESIGELRERPTAVEGRLTGVEDRLAKLDGLLEGLREAVTGRRVSGDAA